MIDVLRIKRRPKGGKVGPPDTLAASELAYNEQEDVLYYGRGNRDGQAESIVPIAGALFVSQLERMSAEIERLSRLVDRLERERGQITES
jgi:hypothetical protein